VPLARIALLTALAALGISCRSGPPPAIDPALAARVPAAATIVAGVNLEQVRNSPLRQQLPPAALAFLESLQTARSVLVASDGANYLVLMRGDFQQARAGSTLLASGLAAMGSPDWLRGAQSNKSGPGNAMIPRAEAVAASAGIWMAAAGSANLPVTGNGENLNRLLHATEYATLAVRLTDNAAFELTALCGGPEPARNWEETVRAFAQLGAAATRRQPQLSGLLRQIRITRDDRTVHVDLTVQPSELEAVLKLLGIGS
jgi:hypothetical protein